MGDSKSGFELRSDLLGLAVGILESRTRRQFDNETLKPEGDRQPLTHYATEDVVVVAETLYAFVKSK
jgi:hypothetical protein